MAKAGKVLLLAASALFLIWYVWHFTARAYKNMPAAAVYEKRPIPATIERLSKDFDDNEVRAAKLWSGREVAITGTVDSIGTELLGKPYVILTDGERKLQAVFPVERKHLLMPLSRGMEFRAQCAVGGRTMGIILLTDCR